MTERPNIISVKNDVIQIAIPYIEGTKKTYTTGTIIAGGTALTVKDNTDFAQNDYIIIGAVGQKQTEIVRITGAVSAGTSLTISATTFAHPSEGTLVTLIRYDQVELYGSSSASDVAPTIIGSAVSIDVSNGLNEIKAGTTYTYYYARYKNSNASTYSSYSDAAIATGLSELSRGEIKKEYMSTYNVRIDDLITDDWFNRGINRWQRSLYERRKQWSWLRDKTLIETVADTQSYDLPTTISDPNTPSAIISMKYAGQREMTPWDQEVFLKFTSDYVGSTLAASSLAGAISITLTTSNDFADPTTGTSTVHIQGDDILYTTNTQATGVLSGTTDVDDAHTAGDEVWQTYSTGIPTNYTVDRGSFKVFPIVGSVEAGKNIELEFWKKFTDLSDDSDETECPFTTNCYLYLNWQESIRRRLPIDEQTARKNAWRADTEDMVIDDPDFRDIRIQPHDLYKRIY